jgi:DNA-binding NarL/FixJ family response regulator
MAERIPVYVHAADPVSEAGILGQLRHRPEIELLTDEEAHRAAVAVTVADEVDEPLLRSIRATKRNERARVVLIATRLDDSALLSAVEAGVSGFLRRSEASAERIVAVVQSALAGDGTVPPDLLGRLLSQVGALQRDVLAPRGLSFAGLTHRELEVLRLVADGFSTSDIAKRLAYSERTVKNVIHDLTTRLQLRNRSHAVAYALRQGLI